MSRARSTYRGSWVGKDFHWCIFVLRRILPISAKAGTYSGTIRACQSLLFRCLQSLLSGPQVRRHLGCWTFSWATKWRCPCFDARPWGRTLTVGRSWIEIQGCCCHSSCCLGCGSHSNCCLSLFSSSTFVFTCRSSRFQSRDPCWASEPYREFATESLCLIVKWAGLGCFHRRAFRWSLWTTPCRMWQAQVCATSN